MEIKIVIPTYKRAGNIPTLKAISQAILCVAASEVPLYREHYTDVEIVEHPDSVIGLAPKRQWIYDKFGDVLMVDDDIAVVSRLYLSSCTKRATALTPDQAWAVAQWAGNTAHLCGCFLFGFNKQPMPLIYNPFAPIALSGFVTGCALGLLRGSRISFASESVAVEDFYCSGVNAYFHRNAFIDCRFNFQQTATFKSPGGLAAHRTIESEKKDTLFLRRLFGEAITIKAEGSGGKRTSSKNKNQYGRTLTIPF